MAAYTAATVMLRSGAYLNDPANITFTYVILLPYLRMAMDDLQSVMVENGISFLDTKTAVLALSAVTSVGITSASNPALPTDLLLPISLEERPTSSGALFSPMYERETLPERPQGLYLGDWTWEEDGIKLIGSIQATDVKIIYQKELTAITASGDSIPILGAKHFLATKTAAYAARYVGNNSERADSLDMIAEREVQRFLRGRVKEAQDYPTRRLPYGFLRRQLRRQQTHSGR